ncbi:FAD-binding oxidoreductase [Actinoplanes sp. NPDC048988]|uniref:FAD-binding oxidoreductase n=1 Tax=Actinoplanes sp. NPDC048988 TaxID=3363901 RepID=UPI00371FEA0E
MNEFSMGRRRFLGLTAAAGAAAASAALLGEPVAAATSTVDYAGLKRALKGPLLRPGDAGYAVAARPYNSALGVRRPAAIAKVAGVDDVRTCVRRVRGHGVPLAARAGGHSYAGFSTPNNGVVVDLSALKGITIRGDGTAVVGAGVRLIDLYSALAAHGRALPAGSCPTVGVAGSTLGGGIGVVARTYGLTCDHLRAATVVTADGAVHTVDGNHDADLLWALRGGGGGNGGIVTSFTFGTVPAPTVTVFTLRFPAARTSRVLRAWSQWMDAAPDQLTSLCAVTAASTPANRVTGAWTGSASALTRHLTALISAVGASPTSRTVHTYNYLTAMKYFAGCLSKTVAVCHTPGQEAFRAASRMLDRTVTASIADRVVALMRKQKGMVLLFDSLRGQVGRIRAADTAFVHRGAHASVQVYSGNAANGPAVLAVQQALAPIVGHGSYVNYLNPGQKDWASAYYGTNLPRLRQVIRKYDPARVFDFQQSVLRA